jgi:hypothetical protein
MADPLASIPRDVLYSRKLAIREDDEMTEQTSRTDDDILHDAFSFLNRAESETQSEVAEGSDDGDEIVWDLRYASFFFIFVHFVLATSLFRTSTSPYSY